MIVVESAREHLEVGFWDYARFGIPSPFSRPSRV